MTSRDACPCGHAGPASHLRLLHPDVWGDGPERWDDGEPVVIDTTLQPEDFR